MLGIWRLWLSSDDGQAGHFCFSIYLKNIRCMEKFCWFIFLSSLVALGK